LIFGADILVFGAKISKSYLIKVKDGGEGGGSGDLLEVSASVSGKIFRPTLDNKRVAYP